MNPDLLNNIFQPILALLTIGAAIYATKTGFRGKRAELTQQKVAAELVAEQADRKQSFEELLTSLKNARTDLEWANNQLDRARADARLASDEKDELAKEAREERERLQTEWIERNNRLLNRCQSLAVQLKAILNGPLILEPGQKERIETAVEELADHIREDHLHFDD